MRESEACTPGGVCLQHTHGGPHRDKSLSILGFEAECEQQASSRKTSSYVQAVHISPAWYVIVSERALFVPSQTGFK